MQKSRPTPKLNIDTKVKTCARHFNSNLYNEWLTGYYYCYYCYYYYCLLLLLLLLFIIEWLGAFNFVLRKHIFITVAWFDCTVGLCFDFPLFTVYPVRKYTTRHCAYEVEVFSKTIYSKGLKFLKVIYESFDCVLTQGFLIHDFNK